jgi:hypothetical protein
MKNKLKLTLLVILFANLGFAQQNAIPAKGSLKQASTIEKTGSTGDAAKGESFDVAEGKKGLNAVNVKKVKEGTDISQNGRTTKPNGQDDGNPFPPKNSTTSLQKPKEKSNDK